VRIISGDFNNSFFWKFNYYSGALNKTHDEAAGEDEEATDDIITYNI